MPAVTEVLSALFNTILLALLLTLPPLYWLTASVVIALLREPENG